MSAPETTVLVWDMRDPPPDGMSQHTKDFMAWGSDPRAPIVDRWLYSMRDVQRAMREGFVLGAVAGVVAAAAIAWWLS